MKVKLQIEKICCKRTTLEIGKDEIFCGVLVLAGKMEAGTFKPVENKPVLLGAVSEVKKKVGKGTTWRPAQNNFVIDIGDATVLSTLLLMYEADDLGIYTKVKNTLTEIVKPDTFNWAPIIKKAKDSILKDINDNGEIDAEDILSALTKKPQLAPLVLGQFLFVLAKESFKFFKQDDFLGAVTDSFIVASDDFNLPREYPFRKHRGKYDVALRMDKI